MKYHVAVIGSGIAGLNFAINLAERRPDLNILILDKSISGDCNTRNARGGIASIMTNSQLEKHFSDTVEAGCGLNDNEAVIEILKSGPNAIEDLIEIGVRFNKDVDGKFDMHLEGGHSERRIFHHKDITGKEILDKLRRRIREKSNVFELKGIMALDFIKTKSEDGSKTIQGLLAYDIRNNLKLEIQTGIHVIASGGLGQIYEHSSNSNIATGDGIAMAVNVGAELQGMEFVQFHPTALYQKGVKDLYLITEALRGEGAKICDNNGIDLLDKHNGVHHLSPRYKVSLAIKHELIKSKSDFIYLDCRSIEANILKENFRSFWKKCEHLNLDPRNELIPITPAAHYLCGGIKTDLNGLTSIEALFALGESANTGLHGANRLASNSLLEAMVLSKNCSHFVSQLGEIRGGKIRITGNSPKKMDQNERRFLNKLKTKLQRNMESNAGLIRTPLGLEKGLKVLKEIELEMRPYIRSKYNSKELFELSNMLVISKVIFDASLKRKKSIGAFYLEE